MQAGQGSPTRRKLDKHSKRTAVRQQARNANMNACAPGQAGVGMQSATAGNSAGAGTLVGSPEMLPMAAMQCMGLDKVLSHSRSCEWCP